MLSESNFKIRMEIFEDTLLVLKSEIIFKENFVYDILNDSVFTIFNLNEMWFLESKDNLQFTQSDCEDFFKKSADKTKATIKDSNDSSVIKLVSVFIDPNYSVKVNGSKEIIISNDYLEYIVEDYYELSSGQNKLVFAYDVLAAYQKAIHNKRVPPFPQIELSKILKEKSILPKTLTATIKTGPMESRETIKYQIEEISENDYSIINKMDEYIKSIDFN